MHVTFLKIISIKIIINTAVPAAQITVDIISKVTNLTALTSLLKSTWRALPLHFPINVKANGTICDYTSISL